MLRAITSSIETFIFEPDRLVECFKVIVLYREHVLATGTVAL